VREPTKIKFHHSRIRHISDFTELVEILLPGNRNQQHAAACIFFELKWAIHIVPNLTHIEKRYDVSRRTLQRTRAKLSRLGLIEYIGYLNSRYGGRHGWRLSSRFERALNLLALKCADLRNTKTISQEKERLLLEFTDTKRMIPIPQKDCVHRQNQKGGEAV
jgi:hypothetical protein